MHQAVRRATRTITVVQARGQLPVETSVRTLGRLAVRCMSGQSPTTAFFSPHAPPVLSDKATVRYRRGEPTRSRLTRRGLGVERARLGPSSPYDLTGAGGAFSMSILQRRIHENR